MLAVSDPLNGPNGAVYIFGDSNSDGVPDVSRASCSADVSGDGVVDGVDLGILIGSWGDGPPRASDVNNTGVVDVRDLAYLLGSWGVCQ